MTNRVGSSGVDFHVGRGERGLACIDFHVGIEERGGVIVLGSATCCKVDRCCYFMLLFHSKNMINLTHEHDQGMQIKEQITLLISSVNPSFITHQLSQGSVC